MEDNPGYRKNLTRQLRKVREVAEARRREQEMQQRKRSRDGYKPLARNIRSRTDAGARRLFSDSFNVTSNSVGSASSPRAVSTNSDVDVEDIYTGKPGLEKMVWLRRNIQNTYLEIVRKGEQNPTEEEVARLRTVANDFSEAVTKIEKQLEGQKQKQKQTKPASDFRKKVETAINEKEPLYPPPPPAQQCHFILVSPVHM